MTPDQLDTLEVADAGYLRDLMEGDAYLDMDDPPHDQYTDEEQTDIEDHLDVVDITPSLTTSRLPMVEETTPREDESYWKRKQRRRGITGPSALMLRESTWEDRGRRVERVDEVGDEDEVQSHLKETKDEEPINAAADMWRRFLDNLPESWKTNLSFTHISKSRITPISRPFPRPSIHDIYFLPSLRGRPRSASPPLSSSTFTSSPPPHMMQNLPPAFEERFRWKICSSGLLDVAPKATIGVREGGENGGTSNEGRTTTRPRSYSSTSSSSYITSLTHLSRTAPWDRLDVFLATLVAIGGVWRIVGWIWLEVVAALTIMFCAALGGLIGEERIERGRRKREEREVEERVQEQERKGKNVDEQESLQAMALTSLEAFIMESDGLDEQIGMGLGLLEESTSSESTTATTTLRERLDSLLKSLSARISDVTVSLFPLASETELAGLAEMYGIDEMRAVVRGPVKEDNDDQLLRGVETPQYEQGNAFEASSASPAHPVAMETTPARISSSWSKGCSATTSYPSSPFESDARHIRLSRSISHLPLVPNLLSPTEDRLTPLPRRSPLPGQRASWQERKIASPSPGSPSMWERPIGAGINYGTPSRPGKTTRWPSTVTEERDDVEDTTALGFQSVSRPPFKGSRLSFSSVDDASDIMPPSVQPPSPPRRPTHKLRELRLSQSGITGFSAVLGENGLPTPITRPEDRQRKRRSLQDTGYKRLPPGQFNGVKEGGRPLSVNLDVPLNFEPERDPQVSLARAKSLPGRRNGHLPSHSVPNARNFAAVSPKPALSRGDSFRSEKLGESTRRPRAPSRAASLDPLTAAGLKASFFAMHRKRRQAVCCLLALYFNSTPANTTNSEASWDLVRSGRFDEVEIARYWANVHVLLDDLQRELKVSKEDLQVVIGETRTNLGPTVRQPLPPHHAVGYNNFAPRTTDKVLLDDHIVALLHHLSQAEQRIQAIRVQNTSDVLHDHLAERWELVRGDIGGMIGDWERGRLVINRMMGRERGMVEQDSEVEEDLPAFLEDWTETPSQAVEKDLPDTDTDVASAVPMIEDDASKYLLDSTSPAFLPPPGLEAVFEATCVRAASATSMDGRKLTREERIKATRAAREQTAKRSRGLSDVENQAPSSGKDRSGEMVSELKNVIGELRRRKEAVVGGGAGRANVLRDAGQ